MELNITICLDKLPEAGRVREVERILVAYIAGCRDDDTRNPWNRNLRGPDGKLVGYAEVAGGENVVSVSER